MGTYYVYILHVGKLEYNYIYSVCMYIHVPQMIVCDGVIVVVYGSHVVVGICVCVYVFLSLQVELVVPYDSPSMSGGVRNSLKHVCVI